jgi:hypothetical protein
MEEARWVPVVGRPRFFDADVRYGFPYVPGNCGLCGAWFQRTGDLAKHHRVVHPGSSMAFHCAKCDRAFGGPHAAACHYCKCRGMVEINYPFICEDCGAGFMKRVGLTQHKRHVHPDRRMAERIAELGGVASVHRGVAEEAMPEATSPMGFGGQTSEDVRSMWLEGTRTHELARKLEDKWREEECPDGVWIDEFVGELTNTLMSDHMANAPDRRQRSRRPRGVRKRRAYANVQEMYRRCPDKLADRVRNDRGMGEGGDVPPPLPVGAIRDAFSDLWGESGVSTREGTAFVGERAPLRCITSSEVRKRVKRIKVGSASGPDGLSKANLTGVAGLSDLLAGLFNMIMHVGYYPVAWRRNRTTMIPKEGKDLSLAEGWRPITVGNILARVFSGVLDQHLRATIRLSTSQRGFVEGNGCFTNTRLLDEAIREGKESRLCGAILDISKAFDCVPHEAILNALLSKGINEKMVGMIKSMYTGISTEFVGCGFSQVIARGVKQGDPLSPLLFNIVLDGLLKELESMDNGFVIRGNRIPALAFADDLVLLFRNEGGLRAGIDKVTGYLRSVGLSLSHSKCGVFGVRGVAKTWVKEELQVQLEGRAIKNFGLGEGFRYLGVEFSVQNGASSDGIARKIEMICARVGKLPLKPMQKLDLLRTYLLPGYYHMLVADIPSLGGLRAIDGVVKSFVKEYFHLPRSVSDGILYCRRADGGLGVPRLENLVRAAHLKAYCRLRGSHDRTVRSILVEGRETSCGKLALGMGLRWPCEESEIDKWKVKMRDEEFTRWTEQRVQGKGIACFKGNKHGNGCMKEGELFPGEHIDLLKMRSNVFPVMACLGRVDDELTTQCRRCHSREETLGHVLGECPAGSGARIARHDAVVETVHERLSSLGWTVAREQLFEGSAGILRPDLVVKLNDKALVIDVTVRFEQGDSLKEGAREKREKYNSLIEVIKSDMGVTSCSVMPIVIGARGGTTSETIRNLKTLGFTGRYEIQQMVTKVVKASIYIGRAHIDCR